MCRHCVVLALSFLLLSSARAQDPEKLSGIWKFTISPKKETTKLNVEDKSDSASPKNGMLIIHAKGDKLTLLDFQAVDKPLEGSKQGTNVELPLQRQFTSKSGEKVRVTLKGLFEDNRLSGSVMIGDREVEWTATRLASVWACSNHTDPVHSAQSEDAMRKLTEKHGCKGWHRLRSENAEAIIKEFSSAREQQEKKP